MKIKVLLNKVEYVKEIVNELHTFASDINVYSRSYVIDAKSLLGLFSLDLSKPVEIEILSDDKYEIEEFEKAVEKYAVC